MSPGPGLGLGLGFGFGSGLGRGLGLGLGLGRGPVGSIKARKNENIVSVKNTSNSFRASIRHRERDFLLKLVDPYFVLVIVDHAACPFYANGDNKVPRPFVQIYSRCPSVPEISVYVYDPLI